MVATFENPFRGPCILIVTNYYQYYYQELSDGGNLRIYLWGATYGGYLWWLPMVATFENLFRGPCLLIVTN